MARVSHPSQVVVASLSTHSRPGGHHSLPPLQVKGPQQEGPAARQQQLKQTQTRMNPEMVMLAKQEPSGQ